MKKIIYKALVLFLAALSVTGCSKDFLNEPAPTDTVSEDVVFGSRQGADAYLAGIIRDYRYIYGTVNTANISSIFFARTMKGNDFIQLANWYAADYINEARDLYNSRSSFTWGFSYNIIANTNIFIKGVTNSTALSESDKKELIGRVKVIRAFFYFQLALEFQKTYLSDPDASAPPVITEFSVEDHPMSTMRKMHELILDDLAYATTNLTEDRPYKSYPNVHCAEALAAEVYQVMGDWANAEKYANLAYGGDVSAALDPTQYGNGFMDANDTEWIWGMMQTDDQSASWYVSPSTTSDHVNGWYKCTYVNRTLVNLFSSTDVRNLFWQRWGDRSDYYQWVTTKFTFDFTSDMVIFRTPEMILIEAEAKYHQGDEAGAHDLLYALQKNRDTKAVKSTNTGNDLFEEILVERRKELYGEMGVEWYDAKRLHRGITRDSWHRVVVNLNPDDIRFVLQVPESEILANDSIDYDVNDER